MNRTSQYDFNELHSSLLEDMEVPSFLVSGTPEKLIYISSDSSQGILSNEQSVCTGVVIHPSNSIEMPEDWGTIQSEALKIVSALECMQYTPKDQSYDASRLHNSEWNISDDFKDESSEKTIPKCHDSKENSWESEAYRLLNEMENYLKGNRSSEGSLILDLNNMDDGLVDTSSTQTTPCDGPKNGTFCNDNDMFSNFSPFYLKQQDDDKNIRVVESLSKGVFKVDGKPTNLMDMESNDLQTVLHCTPVKATPVELHKSMLFSKSKKKSTGLFRASLMSSKDAKGTGKEGLLRKIHKSTSISRGPLKAFPLQTQSSGDPNARASSTPLEAESKSFPAKDPAIGCESKIIKFTSFGSVSSIESGNPNNGAVEDRSGGSLGTPEVFRRRDGPARTSTPAMNIKFSKLGLGGSTATLPTPIVAPESKTSKFSRTVSSEATGVAGDKDSHVSEERQEILKILNSCDTKMLKEIMGSVEKLNPVLNPCPNLPSTEVNNASESQKENIVQLNIAKNSNISDSPIDNLQKENSPEQPISDLQKGKSKPTNIKPQLTMRHPNIVENQKVTLKNGHKSSNGVKPHLAKGLLMQGKRPKSTIQPVQAIKSNITKPSLPSVLKNPMIRKPDPKSYINSKENRPPSSSLPRPSRLRPPSTIPKLV